MPRKSRCPNRMRAKARIKNLAPFIRCLRPGLREDADRLFDLALKGANVLDWLARMGPRPRRPHTEKRTKCQPMEPAPVPKSGGSPSSKDDNHFKDVDFDQRDDARLELLRASAHGEKAFEKKRDELIKRFGLSDNKNRLRIMGSFWAHMSGHHRKRFVARILKRQTDNAEYNAVLRELAALYGTSIAKLESEAASV